jgi:hypothetical protein
MLVQDVAVTDMGHPRIRTLTNLQRARCWAAPQSSLPFSNTIRWTQRLDVTWQKVGLLDDGARLLDLLEPDLALV